MSTTTTETKNEAKPEQLNGTAPLAKVANVGDLVPEAGAQAIVWTRERIDLIKRQVCPAGVTDDEFAIFIEQCKRTQLDPLIKEAFCVPRKVKIQHRDGSTEWVTKHEFQPAEAGMASRADRFPDYRGIKSGAVYANDKIEIDQEAGTVVHKYNPAGDRGALIGAWARAFREGRHTPVEFVKLGEYIQKLPDGKTTGQWGAKPETMIVKCARAAAFRRTYPNTFGGLYIKEEDQEHEERELNPAPSPEGNGKTRTDSVAEKVAARAAAPGPKPAVGQAVTKEEKPAPARQQVVDAGPPLALFGKAGVKGKPLAELSLEDLTELKQQAEDSIAKTPNAGWVPKVQENLGQVVAELGKREAELMGAGSDGAPPPGFENVELPPGERGPAQQKEDPF